MSRLLKYIVSTLGLQAGPKPPDRRCCVAASAGLLLRNLNYVTIIQKPYYLRYIPVMVTLMKSLNSNPVSWVSAAGARLISGGRLPSAVASPQMPSVPKGDQGYVSRPGPYALPN